MTSLVYNDGTASVTNGSPVVAGHGTAWVLGLVAGGSFSLGGMSVPIASVDSDTLLTLAYDWPGTTEAEQPYAIALETAQAVRAAWINDRLASFHQKPWGIGVIPDGRGTLAERDALDPMPVDDFCWLRVEVDEPAELYFKVPSGWLGPYSFSGSDGPPGPPLVPAGEWVDDVVYQRGRYVSHGGLTFASRVDGNLNNEPPSTATDSAEWMFLPLPDGPKGDTGDGWAAVLAVVTDGARRVHQVVDWIGGDGPKPATGQFVGPEGYVATAAEAVDVRGAPGAGDGDVVGPDGGVTDGHAVVFDGATGKLIRSAGKAPFSGSYNDLENKPTLGSVSGIDLPSVPTGKLLDDSGNWIAPPEGGGYDPNMALLALEMADLKGSRMGMVGGVADPFDDESGIDAGASSNYEHDAVNHWFKPTEPSRTVFGNYPDNAILFDGDTATYATRSATNAYAGLSFSVPPTIASATARPFGSAWFNSSSTGSPTCIVYLYGKNGAAPSSGTDGTLLGQMQQPSAGASVTITPSSPAPYDHIWFYITTTGATFVRASEFEFSGSFPRFNMTLTSVAYPAASEPALGRVAVQLVESDPITINDDVTAEISRDGGTTWAQATLALVSSLDSVKLYEDANIDLSGQPSGDDVVWRVKTDNNIDVAVSGVVAQWR